MAISSTSFKPGCAGGPGRRRGSKNVATRYKEEIRQHFGDPEFGEVVEAMITRAKDGDVAAAKLLLSYRLGQPVAHTETTTDLTVSSRSAAAETLASAFGIDELPTRPDDDDDEFDPDDPALNHDEPTDDSGGMVEHPVNSVEVEGPAETVEQHYQPCK